MIPVRLLKKLGAVIVSMDTIDAIGVDRRQISHVGEGGEDRPLVGFSKTIAPTISALAACVIASAAVIGVTVNYYNAGAIRRQVLGDDALSLAGQIKDLALEARTFRSELFNAMARLHPDRRDELSRVQDKLEESLRKHSGLGPPARDATAIDPQVAGDPRELLRLFPALGPLDVSFAQSATILGMLVLRVPSLAVGGPVPVFGMLDGRVIAQAVQRDGTYRVELRHASGYVTAYDNLRSIDVRPGEWVTRGEKIGDVHAASPVCLRIGLKSPDGQFIDPRPFMPPKSTEP